jgi:hypothetical protein
MRVSVSVILLALLSPTIVLAQRESLASLEPGARIRVTAATVAESERIGQLTSASPDSIYYRPDSRPVIRSLALQNLGALEVRRNTGTRSGEYAAILALAGGVIGYVSSNHNGTGLGTGKTEAGQNAVVGGIAGAVIGGALGWWYGGKKKVEEWRSVDR